VYGDSFRFICGASIIAERFLLCAAHCFFDEEMNRQDDSLFRFVVGTQDISRLPNDSQLLPASRIITHREYNHAEYDNDIALIHLVHNLTWSDTVQPVKLGRSNPPTGTICYVTGFGKTNSSDVDSSPKLMEATLPIVSHSKCKRQYAMMDLEVTKDMLCAGYSLGGTAACSGDSGGPLVSNYTGKWEQYGVTSFGPEVCGSKEAPGVYACVAYFRDWIENRKMLLTRGFKIIPG
jgi:secreted trypsin-like serine protease